MSGDPRQTLVEQRTPTNLKPLLLWTSLMFLYIQNDYFSLYTAGTIDDMARGRVGPLGAVAVADALLTGLSMMMALPALMIFLSAALPPLASRSLNVTLGLAYTGIEIMTLFGSPVFYKIIVAGEIVLTALIVFHALRWPKKNPIDLEFVKLAIN